MLAALIDTFKKNPLLAAAWTVFLAAGSFSVQHLYAQDQALSQLASKAKTFTRTHDEYVRAERAIAGFRKMDAAIAELVQPVKAPFDTADEAVEAVNANIPKYVIALRGLDLSRIEIANLYFRDAEFTQIRDGLVKDVDLRREYLLKRLRLLQDLQRGSTDAFESVLAVQGNIDGLYGGQELHARSRSYDEILGGKADEENGKIAEWRSEQAMYRARSWLFIASLTYMGAFIGGLLAFRLSAWRRAKAAVAKSADDNAEGDRDRHDLPSPG